MSVRSVARKDLRNSRRSIALWVGGMCLACIAVLLAYANQGFSMTDTEAVQQTFHLLTIVLSLLLPIVALVVSYLAIAGEREGGGIKFLLSLPNRRREVFAGKVVSRVTLLGALVLFVYVAATSVALAKHGAFPALAVLGTLVATLVYGSVFVSIGVALSATVGSQSGAIARSLVAYFVLVLLYLFPVIRISNVVQAFHTELLGMDRNPDLYNAIEHTSPYRAYQKTTNLVVPEQFERHPFADSAQNAAETARSQAGEAASSTTLDLPIYLTDEFSLLVLALWLVVPLVVGYRAFERAELE